MYKASIYNIILDETNEDVLVFNTFSNAICKLSKTIWKSMRSNSNLERIDFFNDLLKKGFVVPSELNEINRVLAQERKRTFTNDSTNISFTIAPTLACNLKCFYCFEGTHTNCIMAKDTLDRILDLLSKLIEPKTKNVHINWFGGEPLLAIDIIKEISKKVMALCIEHNIQYSASMITNGTLLSSETALFLVNECGLKLIQITMDGDCEEYCKRKGATPSQYNLLIKNIVNCSKLIDIQVRLNCDLENFYSLLRAVDQVFSYPETINKVRFYLAPIKDYNNEGLPSLSAISNTEKYMLAFQKWMKTKYPDAKPTINQIKRKVTYCNLKCLNNYVIGPQGELYSCEHDFGFKDRVIGDIHQGYFYNQYMMDFIDLSLPENCKQCALLPVCLGGCPSIRYHAKKTECRYTMEYLKTVILTTRKSKK